MKKKTYVTDVEIYGNYLLIGFKNVVNKKVISFEVVGKNSTLSREHRKELLQILRTHRTVGFNTLHFDWPIIFAAIAGATVKRLKQIANDIIEGGMKSWDVERAYGFSIPRGLDHIDLIEVAPGKASLKIYNGRLHGRRMQDLPIEPEALLTEEEIEEVYTYWVNDLDSTILLFTSLSEQLALREAMSEEYRQDLRSKSDAQVAEAVIKKRVASIMGADPQKPNIPAGTGYPYKPPAFIKFRHPALKAILREIEDATFRVDKSGKIIMPQALKDAEIAIGRSVYRMGIGGLHSSEECQAIVPDEDHILVDRDVTSYYPFIIKNLGLRPKQLGWAFLKVYKAIISRRISAKAQGKDLGKQIDDLKKRVKSSNDGGSLMQERIEELEAEQKKWSTVADSLKITLNGSFGKFGSRYSVLYSPDLMIAVTLTGQLSLLMLIEWLEEEGISVVSANTDGIVILCPKRRKDALEEVIAEWEKATGFGTEETRYKALYSRDVNNYIAVKTDGKAKTKGAYAKTGFQKNPTNEICVDAVIAYITEGKSLYKTIRACRDITKFLTVRSVTGGAIWGVKEVEVERFSKKTGKKLKSGVAFDSSGAEYLGKAIRWYYSEGVEGSIHYKSNGNKVPRSEGARPLMELPDEFPDDVDIGWYVREARSILKDIGYLEDLL